ncbi:hypothetical protein [Formosa sp. S-31]|uniref:hypothetical protein n=1 Tax=Formosa sp. S-31 TaxID=2790949 RepID=UPI003EC142C9
MKTITRTVLFLLIFLCFKEVQAQNNSQNDSVNVQKVEALKLQKEEIRAEEKALLREDVERINTKVDEGHITVEEGEILKKEASKKHALNIENRVAILDNKIELLTRNNEDYTFDDEGKIVIKLGKDYDSETVVREKTINIGREKACIPVYDKRTTSDLVFGIGFNNALIEGEQLGDSPYKLGGSGFVELGWAWKTRVFEDNNALRLKYGVSFQWNKFDIKNNEYFVENGDVVALEAFPFDVRKSKFRTTNLVFPVHFEFGPSKKIEHDTYFRYSTEKKFKMGIGGYGGFNIASLQKVKYYEDGNKEKKKYKDFDAVNSFVYGLSAYMGWGDVGLYFKYDLSPIFRHQEFDQNNISLGIRFDMD